MFIISGAKGDYFGRQEFFMERLKVVKEVMKQYDDETLRIKLKEDISSDEKLAQKYLDCFGFYDMIYVLDKNQEECVKYIKACLESISNERELNKLVKRYNSKSERLEIKNEIRYDNELTKKYIAMFKKLKEDIGLNKEQKKCLTFIRLFGKKFKS